MAEPFYRDSHKRGRSDKPAIQVMNPETRLHIAIAKDLEWLIPTEVQWSTFPAGNVKLPPRVGGLLKDMGLKTGWPDIILVHAGSVFGMELKAGKGPLSASQKDRHPLLIAAGMKIAVCRSIDDVLAALADWGIPIRISKPVSVPPA